MGQLSDQLRALLDASTVGVLATVAPDGKPRHRDVQEAGRA
jgi:hypothetical protein